MSGAGVIDLAPVVAPIQEDRALLTRLQVVLAARHDFERHFLPAPQKAEQHPAPREQEQRGKDEGGAHRGTLLQHGELAEHEQAGDEAGVEEKGAASRKSGAGLCVGGGARARRRGRTSGLFQEKFKVESTKFKVKFKVRRKKSERSGADFHFSTLNFAL